MSVRLFLLFAGMSASKCARILCVFPLPSTYAPTYQTLAKELALRGHHVSLVSANSASIGATNLTEIEISSLRDIMRTKKRLNHGYLFSTTWFAGTHHEQYVEEVLSHLETIFPDPGDNFDLVIAENVNPLVYSLRYRFKARVIGISLSVLPVFNQDLVGNPSNPSLYFDEASERESEFGYFERVNNFLNWVVGRTLYYFYYLPFVVIEETKVYIEDDYSHIWNLDPIFNFYFLCSFHQSAELILANRNSMLHSVRANVPNFVEISDLTCTDSRNTLPTNLQNFLDHDDRGVVYIDLGFDLDPKMKNIITETMMELPYNVIWNSELDGSSNKTQKFYINEGFISAHILRHKNVKAFITKGDLPSVQEAIVNCVPIVGIPSTIEQVSNVLKLTHLGVATVVDPLNISKFNLHNAISEITRNEYKTKLQCLNTLLQDRPMGDLNKTIWWIEYVIRNKGATFLRSPAADIHLYEYLMLDIVAVLLLISVCVVYITKIFYLLFIRRLSVVRF